MPEVLLTEHSPDFSSSQTNLVQVSAADFFFPFAAMQIWSKSRHPFSFVRQLVHPYQLIICSINSETSMDHILFMVGTQEIGRRSPSFSKVQSTVAAPSVPYILVSEDVPSTRKVFPSQAGWGNTAQHLVSCEVLLWWISIYDLWLKAKEKQAQGFLCLCSISWIYAPSWSRGNQSQ